MEWTQFQTKNQIHHFSQPFCNWDESSSINSIQILLPHNKLPNWFHSWEGRIPGPAPAKMYAGWTAPSRFPSVAKCARTAKGLSLLTRFSFLKTKTSCGKVHQWKEIKLVRVLDFLNIQWPGALSINMYQRYMNLFFIISLRSWKKIFANLVL